MPKPTEMFALQSGKHETGSKEWNEHKMQQKVKDMMAKRNLTYIEAREMLPINTSNLFEALSNLDQFPTFAETLTTNNCFRDQWQLTNQPRNSITAAVRTYPEKKKNTQQHKRKRTYPETKTEQQPTAGPSGTSEKPKEKAENGVGLNNPYKVDSEEKWQQINDETSRKSTQEINSKPQ